jgi:hypothetical protein
MQVKCTSCGASQNINQAQNCDFCGNLIEMESAKKDFQSTIVKKKLKKCKIDDDNSEIKHENRSIDNIQEVIYLYSDIEIDNTETLNLSNNYIRSLKGVSRFTVNDLDVSRNNLISIDELPSTRSSLFYYNFRYNANLNNISDDVISYINSKRDVKGVVFYFNGCDSFNVESLSKINYDEILSKPCIIKYTEDFEIKSSLIRDYNPNKTTFEIEPPLNAEMPETLRALGFKKIVSKFDFEGFYVENKNERNRCIWLLEKERYLKDNSESKEKEGCFIATATMGNYDDPILIDLRCFRDNWLKRRNWGVKFIDWYYVYGFKAAKVIEKSKILRIISFILLVKPLHIIIKKLNYIR